MSVSWYDITPYINHAGDVPVSKLRAVIPVSIHIDIPWYYHLAGQSIEYILALVNFYNALENSKNYVKQQLESQGFTVESISYTVTKVQPNFWLVWITSIDVDVVYDVVVSAREQGYTPGLPQGIGWIALGIIVAGVVGVFASLAWILTSWFTAQAQIKLAEANMKFYALQEDYYRIIGKLYDICKQQPDNPICKQYPPPPQPGPGGGGGGGGEGVSWTTYLGIGLGLAVAVVGGAVAYRIITSRSK